MEGADDLKITINIDETVNDTEIQISCRQLTLEIEKILATLRIMNQQMMVMKEDETHLIDVSKIIYVEAMERKTFVYTQNDYYESKLKLYEMEERLVECGFFRESGEQIMVSRQYADEIKRRLGV